jgi:hypothetical protein
MTTESRHQGAGPWASGLTVFAGLIMLMIGVFQFFEGLAAIVNDQFFVVTEDYTFNIDTTAWGWVHLIFGVVLALIGIAVVAGQTWGRLLGIVVVGLSMVSNFLFIPYYPLWSIVMIALGVAVIWALMQPTNA